MKLCPGSRIIREDDDELMHYWEVTAVNKVIHYVKGKQQM